MCGRFAFFSPREAIAQAFPIDLGMLPEARFNIAPSQNVLIIRSDDTGSLMAESCRWGLVPFWAKDPAIGNRMINARAETITEKPAFRQSFNRRRCLVMADGFYEWQQDSEGKRPYFICRGDKQPFGMAGLWDQWAKGPGDPLRSCTVITLPANEFMQRLHHRMPVLMDWDAARQWLEPAAVSQQLRQLLLGSSTIALQAWQVSNRVNNPINDSADLIVPVAT
jgi:putative SOS response-associated peptidase YedK